MSGEVVEMRVGQNPAKRLKEVAKPAEITVAVTTYIPFLSGYFEQSLDVFKLSLESLIAHADLPYDLMVFDNASCEEVRSYLRDLQRAGKIQYLILSEKNMGVVGAWNMIFGAAPGKYIAYSDYDIYFFPNWLSALIEILETFPQAGMVTGLPLLSPIEFSNRTLEWAEQSDGIMIESGELIAWEDFWRHSQSISPSVDKGENFFAENQSYRINYQGRQCYIGAGHFQFAGRKKYFEKVTPLFAGRPMGDEVRNLDIAINEQGYLRLCTTEWYVEHMGNTVQDKFVLQEVDQSSVAGVKGKGVPKGSWISRVGFIRRILRRLYNRIFRILYGA